MTSSADLRDHLQSGLGGAYTLDRELGRGGMATVYVARDLKHDRKVAIKILHADLAVMLGPERGDRIGTGATRPAIATW
ncbi:MAG: hypothetical protein ACR2M1_13225 [Gemmatimonadaceae bacterium]